MSQTSDESMGFDLPVEIIQHIQSFLDGDDEVLRTSLLSKSWYNAWSTGRSTLVFKTKTDFKKEDNAEFWNNVSKTIKRYKQSNLTFNKLVLDHQYESYGDHEDYKREELIADASAMGITDLDLSNKVTRNLLLKILAIESLITLSIDVPDLKGYYLRRLKANVLCPSLISLRLHGPYDGELVRDIILGCPLIETLDFKFKHSRDEYSIFPSELFALRPFTKLSISGCYIQIQDQRVLFSHLVSLCFFRVYIEDDDVENILSGCRLLENLEMEECKGASNIDVSDVDYDYLVAVRIQNCSYSDSPTLCSNVSFGPSDSRFPYYGLRSVFLSKAIVDDDFFSNFPYNIPDLKDLTLDHCTGFGSSIHISSHSLEYIQLHVDEELQKVKIDVPNIRKFVFETCDHVPSLSFRTKSMEWESKVTLSCTLPVVKSSLFLKLTEFLKELSLSSISLSVNFEEKQLIWVKDILPWLPTPVVEYLQVNNDTKRPVTHDILCALFRCCRPTFLSICRLNSYGYSCAKLLHDLFQINHDNAKCLNKKMQSLLMYDLEEIDLVMLEGKLQSQATPLSTFIEDADPVIKYRNRKTKWFEFPDDDDDDKPVSDFKKEEIRFRLKWGAFRSCTSS